MLIFVTEDFSDSLRVKADPGKHAAADVFPVLKLNFVRDFQTGIYDYNVLTSSFFRTESGFAPAKISFSSQEWCGHVYEQLLTRGNKIVGESHSYFDGEADAQRWSCRSSTAACSKSRCRCWLRGLRRRLVGARELRRTCAVSCRRRCGRGSITGGRRGARRKFRAPRRRPSWLSPRSAA